MSADPLHDAHFRAAKPKFASGELERLIGRDARQAGFVGAPGRHVRA